MNKITIKARILILIALVIGAIAAIGLIGNQAIENNAGTIKKFTRNLVPSLNHVHTVSEGRALLHRTTLQTAIWQNDYHAQDKFADIVKRKKELWLKIEKSWAAYLSIPKANREVIDLTNKVMMDMETVKKADEAIILTIQELSKNDDPKVQKERFEKFYRQYDTLRPLYAASRENIEKLIAKGEVRGKEEGIKAEESTQSMRILVLIISLVAIAAVVVLSLLILASINRPLHALRRSIQEISAGHLEQEAPGQEMKNELGDIGRALEKLRHVAQEQAISTRTKTISADIAQALQQCTSFAEFGNVLTSKLAALMELVYGAFYLSDSAHSSLQRVGGYACDDSLHNNHFAWGQGLVGQTAKDKRTILLPLPQEERVGVSVGLGTFQVKSILIMPVINSDEVMGVLELGALNDFSADQQGIVERLLPVVAMNLEILAGNIETRQLLEQSQGQTLALAASERQLLARRDELENQKELIFQAEERSRLILGSVREGIWGLDTEGNTAFVNHAAAEMLGYTEGELIGKPMHALVHYAYPDGSAYPREQCHIYKTFGDGKPRTITDEVLWRKDGTPISVEYSTTPIHRNGDVVGSVVSFHDITERKEAQEYINAYFTGSTDGLLILSPERGFIHANQAAATLFGFDSITDLTGCSPVVLSPELQPDGRLSAEAAPEHITAAMQMSTPLRFDWLHKRTDGTEFPCEITLIKITLAGKPHLLTNIHDITERKQAEEAMKEQMAELERFNQITINRELKMIELKEEINALLIQIGREAKYKIVE